MSTPSRPKARPRRILGPPPLRSADRFPLPVSQRVQVPPRPPEAVALAVSTAVKEGGFTVVESPRARRSEGTVPAAGDRFVFAERSVHRVATDAAMRVSLGSLIGAGVGFGALEAFLFGGAVVALPWCLGGLGLAGLIWWRYGRTYESEVIVVSVSAPQEEDPRSSDPTAAGPRRHVALSAGRVRSVLFGGTRTAVGVKDCPVRLMEALTRVVRRFEAELGLSGPVERVPGRP